MVPTVIFGVPDKFEAVPVVFWFHVGTVPVNPEYATLVAVAALPVHDPELPVTLPVTLPVNGPLNPVARAVPDTSSLYAGALVPMPTFPDLSMRKRSTDEVPNITCPFLVARKARVPGTSLNGLSLILLLHCRSFVKLLGIRHTSIVVDHCPIRCICIGVPDIVDSVAMVLTVCVCTWKGNIQVPIVAGI